LGKPYSDGRMQVLNFNTKIYPSFVTFRFFLLSIAFITIDNQRFKHTTSIEKYSKM